MGFTSPRSFASSSCFFFHSSWNNRDFRTCRAISLFLCWLRVFWQVTMIPVGRCTIRTALSVVFTP